MKLNKKLLTIILRLTSYLNSNFQNGGDEFTEAPGLAMLMAVALAYGVSDAGNHLALNSIIGRLFDERSEVRYSRTPDLPLSLGEGNIRDKSGLLKIYIHVKLYLGKGDVK